MPFPRKITPQQTTALLLLALVGALIAFLIPAVRYFRALTGTMAVSNASDLITQTVSNIVENEMRLLGPDGGKFVSFEKDGDGQISAIVNILSAELLNAIVEASDRGDLDLSIPFGNLLGVSFFLGRGPAVPIKITMLTSSRVDFRNVLTDAGINQTKHQLLLEVCVDADVLLPWEIRSTQIVTEVLIAETIIVGRVPQTYFYTGET